MKRRERWVGTVKDPLLLTISVWTFKSKIQYPHCVGYAYLPIINFADNKAHDLWLTCIKKKDSTQYGDWKIHY